MQDTTALNMALENNHSVTLKEETWWTVNSIASALVAMGQRPDEVLLQKHLEAREPLLAEYLEWFFIHKADPSWMDQVKKDDLELSKAAPERTADFAFEIPNTLHDCTTRTLALYKYYQEHPKLHHITGNQLIDRIA